MLIGGNREVFLSIIGSVFKCKVMMIRSGVISVEPYDRKVRKC